MVAAVSDRELADVLIDAEASGITLSDADTLASFIRANHYQTKVTQAAVAAHDAGELTFNLEDAGGCAGDHTALVHLLRAADRAQLTLADPMTLAAYVHASDYHRRVQVDAAASAVARRNATPEPVARELTPAEQRAVDVIDAALKGRCEHCLRPQATELDWLAFEGGQGQHLCWDEKRSCVWSPSVSRTALIAQALGDAGLLVKSAES